MDLERLRQGLKKPGKTQRGLAKALGVDDSAITRILSGDRQIKVSELPVIYAYLDEEPPRPYLATLGDTHPKQTLPPPNVDLADAKPVPWTGLMPEDVPVFGVAVGGSDGDFSLNGEIVDRVKRPPGIAGNRSAFAIYVRGESMEPRHYQGDLLYVNPLRPARAGDDVLVELKPLRGGDSGAAYVKQLVSQTPVRIVLRQFNPEKEITLPADRVKAVSKILGLAELLGV